MYQYTKTNGWTRIDPIAPASQLEEDDPDTLEGFLGYPEIEMGEEECYSLKVFVAEDEDATINYLAALHIGTRLTHVAIPELPDFVAFLNEVAPGVELVSHAYLFDDMDDEGVDFEDEDEDYDEDD